MIVGLGIDLIEIDRVREVVHRFGDRFLRRVYTDREVEFCNAKADPIPSLAARFAAKEAALKALGTGASRGVFFRHVEVARDKGEAPTIRLHGGARGRAESLGVTSSSLSLTHDRTIAAAVVVLERE